MQEDRFILEYYPDEIQRRLSIQKEMINKNVPAFVNDMAFELVLDDLQLWRVGVLTVSFKGGSLDLHRKIAETASLWSEFGNIAFDFGYDSVNQTYRKWHPNDISHIRIGFEYEGHWSLVGNDSIDPAIILPGEISLNLSDFDKALPIDWKGTVLHEFGHALGFHHEHQTQAIECDFNWPFLYEYLGQPPNEWSRKKVDHNLKQLKGTNLSYSAHDKNSIMHYSFPSWMFLSKEKSPCFTIRNNRLSFEDKEMMGKAYPFDKADVMAIDKMRIQNLEYLTNIDSLPRNISKLHSEHLEYYIKNKN